MGLSHGDLKNSVDSDVTVDHYEPKSGKAEEIIVVSLAVSDIDPAKDLEDFITKSAIGLIDVDVSPNPDENGNYLVFIEFPRESGFANTLRDMLRDVNNIVGEQAWAISTYLGDEIYDLDDSRWEQFVIVDPDNYVSKDDFEPPEEFAETVYRFFQNSLINVVSHEHENTIVEASNRRMVFHIIDIASEDELFESHGDMINNTPMVFDTDMSFNAMSRLLENGYNMLQFKECGIIQHSDTGICLLFDGLEYL